MGGGGKGKGKGGGKGGGKGKGKGKGNKPPPPPNEFTYPYFHPCLRQPNLDKCPFGDNCRFAKWPYDTCLYLLRGSCRIRNCPHLHDEQKPEVLERISRLDALKEGGTMTDKELADKKAEIEKENPTTMSVCNEGIHLLDEMHAKGYLMGDEHYEFPKQRFYDSLDVQRKKDENTPTTHPCIRQFGGCKKMAHGEQCPVADVDFNACLHFLRDQCTQSTCKFPHPEDAPKIPVWDGGKGKGKGKGKGGGKGWGGGDGGWGGGGGGWGGW
eukprot:NODE_3914_length_1142_cov_75.320903_g3724_i0.p1 GENE.NODE_3914_length_1142_cov_75.320903_g3724_i0~~NODE_3914_length_1142_cov_75.320903_g3724_i0.p1  ORF type:complete len:269 (+),score=85.66 NODE_3914_length_1142_cov_75.320903_g3724_i0:69-875(+)